jgi:hypothetical protein
MSCSEENKPDLSNIDIDDRREIIEEMEEAGCTPEQESRKEKSETYCEENKVVVNTFLPCIEDESTANIRSKEEVIERTLALCYIGLKSEQLEQIHLDSFEEKYTLTNSFTTNENNFKNSQNPSDQEMVEANWKYEGLHVLLWSLGFIEILEFPNTYCNVAADVEIIFSKTKEEFETQAELRSNSEILDAADLIYRLDWACVDARVNGKEKDLTADGEIVFERHYVLNWLINYMGQDWDSITTDT